MWIGTARKLYRVSGFTARGAFLRKVLSDSPRIHIRAEGGAISSVQHSAEKKHAHTHTHIRSQRVLPQAEANWVLELRNGLRFYWFPLFGLNRLASSPATTTGSLFLLGFESSIVFTLALFMKLPEFHLLGFLVV